VSHPVTDPTTPPLEISFDVEATQQHAFDTWTTRFGSWWPGSHTVSGHDDAVVELQPEVGGVIGERLPDGTHHAWGRVTTWQPPEELAYDWHFGRESADATRVRIRFVALDDHRTRVEIHHDGWAALGEEAETWRERNVAGWQGMLPHYLSQLEKETR
jgi:activator of Hsp90 ATPase-like protein